MPEPSGTEFKGEGRTFNPNTPRDISQSTSWIAWRKEGESREGSSWSDARFEDEAGKSIQ
jgi:hypothetical protein